jgi:ATP-dependent Clp protease ATP-binding subunit ClpC
MSTYTFDPHSPSITIAKLAVRIQPWVLILARGTGAVLLAMGIMASLLHIHHANLGTGLGLLMISICSWLEIAVVGRKSAIIGTTAALDQLLPNAILAAYHPDADGLNLWKILSQQWQISFILGRFSLPASEIEHTLAGWVPDGDALWTEAIRIATLTESPRITAAAIFTAVMSLNPSLTTWLTERKLEPSDIAEGAGWVSRLETRSALKRPIYGGIARDWAAGFTPTLSQFAQNLSRQIEAARGNFVQQERLSQLDALTNNLAGVTGSVAVIGETGIGKTALLYGLADRLLRGDAPRELKHNQVVSLNASSMLSRVTGPGDLERIVLTILGEAVRAGNMVVALDEAQLFFGQGTGAVNLSQVLLPIVQSRRLKLVLTLTPGDWQRLKSTNTALAGLLTPVVLSEPSRLDTLRLLADRALTLEPNGVFITYQALGEAYTLSARYNQDEAHPGRSLKLLAAAMPFAEGPLVTANSVARAVESQFGVKIRSADATETDTLLNLEAKIHERMINQTRAVTVVSAALRRARAGVSNPKRPIGSFLFLGPTGVGKTELAKSVAALYFGSESSLIRLDMSEYQQASDITRLLGSAAENPTSLLPKIRQQPFSVVLFDEIEKANPSILNLLLQLLDEGNLTDSDNKATSFRDAIIIATSNAGADEIRDRIARGEELSAFESEFIDNLISGGSFKPELLNRFDEIVLFRPLNESELVKVVGIMIAEVNQTLSPQKVSVTLTTEAITALVHAGYDPRLGARPMRRMVQRTVEDAVAGKILRSEATPGSIINLSLSDLNLAPSANQ